ncbi:MAG: hypothetical protein DRQ62_02830 [Gammaproteobacteria bacterium]|nr:MAG: hypothetical protein DRQ62_02830 [Gammaproteobacteria bacterium]
MRIVVLVLIFGFLQPAMAINKCELNGKVSYQAAACPEQAKSKSLVKDKYISEEQLQEYKREHNNKSEQAFKKVNSPKKPPVVSDQVLKIDTQQTQSQQIQALNDTGEAQVQDVDDQSNKTNKRTAPHVNVPSAFDYVNPKLSDMDRKLEEHNKKLQQLQNAE